MQKLKGTLITSLGLYAPPISAKIVCCTASTYLSQTEKCIKGADRIVWSAGELYLCQNRWTWSLCDVAHVSLIDYTPGDRHAFNLEGNFVRNLQNLEDLVLPVPLMFPVLPVPTIFTEN